MLRKHRGNSIKRQRIWRNNLIITLLVAVICTLPILVNANDENENDPAEVGAAINAGPEEGIVGTAAALLGPAPDPEPISANIIFYKTTRGGGDFESSSFRFKIVRVADKAGTAWEGPDGTVVDNGGTATIAAVPNKAAQPGSFTVRNLIVTGPGDQTQYFFKISEIEDPESGWIYDSREFVIRILVIDVDGVLIAPPQGLEWFYNGVTYDLKGGGNPLPPNENNTFINEYTRADNPLGNLRVKKNDYNETPAFPTEEFDFILSDDKGPVDLTANGILIRKTGGRGTYSGTDLKKGRFELTYDTEVQILGLPVGVYTITEQAEGYEIKHTVSGEPEAPGSTATVTIKEGAETSVAFANKEIPADTRLTIRKALDGDYPRWGVGNDTLFRARIKTSQDRYLTFSGAAPNYTYSGTSATGSEIVFSVSSAAIVTGIPVGTVCTIEEIVPVDARFLPNYSKNTFAIPGSGANEEAVVTNMYAPDPQRVGDLIISKRLAGSFADWGVDVNTVFTARVKDVTDRNATYYLQFKRLPDGNYEAVKIGTGITDIQFSAGKPVVLSELWDDREYEVEEIGGANFRATYSGNGRLPIRGNLNVAVTNTYDHGTGNLVISKRLAGSYGDWGVDGNTVYLVRVRDNTDGNYLLFELQPDGRYLAVGNNGSTNPSNDTREVLRVTASRPIVVAGLWANHVYEVVEAGGANYTSSYSVNKAPLPPGGNLNVVITNTYERGAGNLVIRKVLEGFIGDWGVDENTVFTARVKDDTDKNYLLFTLQDDGTYLAFANNGSDKPTSDARELVRFTAGRPAVIKGVWANHVYIVEEEKGVNFDTAYSGNGVMLPQGGNMNVSITNTYEHGTGRLVVKKANFNRAPAKPHEAFNFYVEQDGEPVDLSANRINIRKTGGSGNYVAVDLNRGRFTLTYDTEVTIDGLPLGRYTVRERASGYVTTFEVIDNSVTRPGDGIIIADMTVIFTNEEIVDTPPDTPEVPNRPYTPYTPPNRPDSPEPNTPINDNPEPDEDVVVEVPPKPTDPSKDPSTDLDDPNSPFASRDPSLLPSTGDGSADGPADGNALPIKPLLPLLPLVLIVAPILYFFRSSEAKKRKSY